MVVPRTGTSDAEKERNEVLVAKYLEECLLRQ